MKTIKNILLMLLSIILAQKVYAQAPSISYIAGISKLTLGSSYSFSPTNSGGTVPATHYGQVAIFAGSPTEQAGYADGTGTAALFTYPQQMVMDASGNLYVADAANNMIREITPAGVVTTFAGLTSGVSGYTNGTGTSASFNYPDGLAIDGSGNIYVSDYSNDAIREISPSGVVTTFYDAGGATFGPGGICFDHSGNLIVAAQDASQIWSINSSGTASVIAGNSPGYYNATGTSAQFNTPTDVRVDPSGNIYVVDFENNAIRKITTAGVVSTFAGSNVSGNTPGFANGVGTAAVFNNPSGLVIGPGGAIYVADLYNNDIRRIMPDGTVTLLAGSSSQVPGDADGLGTAAEFNEPIYMYIDGTGTGYISEFGANRIRKITLTGYTLQGTLPAGLSFDGTTGIISGTPTSLTTSGADTVIAWNGSGSSSVIINFRIIPAPPVISYDVTSNVLTSGTPYTLDPTNSGGAVPAVYYGTTTTFAGNTSGTSGYTNATGTSAKFNQPASSVEDAAGNIYIADGGNNAIRKITTAGVVTTFAGSSSGTSGSSDGTGTAASFNNPQGLAIDNSGNLVVSDYGNNSIRKIDPYGVVTTFYHSTSTFGPSGLTIDNSNDVIVAAKDANQIWEITPAAVQSVIAGSGTAGYSNATGTSAQFNSPTDVKIDASSNLFVADYTNNAIREITPAGVVTTFAGSAVSGNTGGFLDGIGTAAEFNNPAGLAITPGGVIYVADLGNNDIRRILPDGTVDLVAGSTSQTAGNSDGTSTSATFNQPGSVFVDYTSTAYITDLAGNNIRQIALTGYFLVGSLPSGLSFDSSTGEFSGTVSGTITPLSLTVTAFNAGGYSFTPAGIGNAINDWLGGNATKPNDWSTASNWSLNRVPITTDLACIGLHGTAYTYQPIIGAYTTLNGVIGQLEFGMLSPSGGPVLTIYSGNSIAPTLGVSFATSTTAIINGPGSLKPSGTTTIASGEALKAASNLVITLGSVNAVINVSSGGTFILASDPNGSAAIDVIPGTVSNTSPRIKGTVEVDRYVTGNNNSYYRNYRFYSSPVHDAITVNSLPVFSVNYLKIQPSLSTPFGTMNYGNNVYGPTGGNFDMYSPNPTIYFLDEGGPLCNSSFTCGYYRGVTNMTETTGTPVTYTIVPLSPDPTTLYSIPIANGFIAYFTGGPGTSGTSVLSSTMPATGLLNQGPINFVNWHTPSSTYLENDHPSPDNGIDGNNFVGNPYPCTIDLSTYSNTNVNAGIYAYGGNTNPTFIENVSPGSSYGTYIVGTGGTNGASQYIQSGAGFVIVASGSSESLVFNETAKVPYQQVTTAGGTGVIMAVLPSEQTNKQYLRLEMNADTIHKEDILVWFDKSTKVGFEPTKDGVYMRGFNTVSLSSLSSDGVQLGINKQPLPGNERRIVRLSVDVNENGTYHFNLRELVGLPQLYDVFLLDAYRKDSVNLRTNAIYDFNIDKSDTASFGNNRFSLLIKQNPAFAYQLLNFSASKLAQAPRQVQVTWNTQFESTYTNFTVERSIDGGKTFSVIGSVNSAGLGQYSFIDNNPIIGLNFYRLKQVDVNNEVTYSKTAIIGYDNANDQSNGPKLTIFPNPASDKISLVVLPQTTNAAIYNVSISDLSGKVLKQFTLSQTTWQGSVSDLQHGVYYVRVIDNKTQKLVAEGKFSKL